MRIHADLIDHFLQCSLPIQLKELILLYSGHIRLANKSIAYFLYVPK